MTNKHKLLLARLGIAALMIFFSTRAAKYLMDNRPQTNTTEPAEAVLAVKLLTATRTNLTVNIESQGVVAPLRKVKISPQVGGRVIEMPVELKAGDLVEKDQLLLKIDPADALSALEEAKAAVARIEAGLALVGINEDANRDQLKLAERSRDLARKDFERAEKLSAEGQAVSVSVVDNAERAFTQAETQVLQLRQSLAQVPGRRKELESELSAAKARMDMAGIQLRRTEIRAPFDARVLNSRVERGEVLQPGMEIFELADDSVLEIQVPVTADDLRNWISFSGGTAPEPGWFPPLEKVPVEIRWSAASGEISWVGRLDRIMRFDATTRTAMLSVRVEGGTTDAADSDFPLTEGMFCQVTIPGRELRGVYALPHTAVTYDNQCYLNVDGRLKTVSVTVARSQKDAVYVSEGIEEGDRVITTRLVAPLEGIKLLDAGEE